MKRKFVFFGPDGDRFQAQFIGRTKDTDGDFGTVGDKDLGYWQFDLPKRYARALCTCEQKS
jgi:hypothetical protein